jgi:hypothetical protein
MFGAEALILFVGDVVPLNERDTGLTFKHSIEAKAYKTPDAFHHLATGKSLIYTWFREAIDDAKKINRNPLLIFKWNNTPHFCGTYSLPEKIVTLDYEDLHIEIGLLDDILKHQEFWYE